MDYFIYHRMKTFKSGISYGLLIFIFIVFFLPAGIRVLNNGMQEDFKLVFFVLGLIYIFILYFFFNLKYTINKHVLKIKCGIISFTDIDINSITSVKNTKSILSSPAASFKRIEISYGKFDTVIISPKDKNGFIKALLNVNPNIKNETSGL